MFGSKSRLVIINSRLQYSLEDSLSSSCSAACNYPLSCPWILWYEKVCLPRITAIIRRSGQT
uniref:Uncharacterized protein n=1 Tax=Anguilla anguilla TaxID=7936 RepID=A0A0E9VPT1_ANGAN